MHRLDGVPKGYGAQEIKFKKDKEDELSDHLSEQLEQCLQERAHLEEKWKIWDLQSKSRRKRPDARPGDANIDPGITAERKLRLKSALINPVLQEDQIMVCKPVSVQYEDQAMQYEKLFDVIFDRIPIRRILDNYLDQGLDFNTAFIKTGWVHEVTKIKRWEETLDEEYEVGVGDKRYNEKEVEVKTRVGAFPEVIPIEDMIFPICSQSVDTAQWIAHRLWLTKSQLKCRIKQGLIKEKHKGKDILDAIGKPSSDREKVSDFAGTEKDKQPEKFSKQYEIIEFYLAHDVGDGEEVEIIVLMERKSKVILRATYNFYQSYHRPFVPWSYRNVISSLYGIPLTYVLEPSHAAYQGSVNQRLDTSSKANRMITLLPTGSNIKKVFEDDMQADMYYVDEPKEAEQFGLNQPWTQLEGLEQLIAHHADGMVGETPLTKGQQTVDRPTATGDTQSMEEGRQPRYTLLEGFRDSVALLAKHMLSRYRQFYPAGLELYIESVNPEEDSSVPFVWPEESFEENMIVETRVSSATMSKQLRKQEQIALMDKLPGLYEVLMGLAQAATQLSPVSPVAAKLLFGMQTAIDKFMTEFEVSKKEYLNPDLQGDIQIGQQIGQLMQEMDQMAQQLQSLSMENEGLKYEVQAVQAAAQGLPPPPMPQQMVPGPPGMGGPGAGPQAA